MEVDFRECPKCHGYGIKDNGSTCRECGGSGERMFDKETGRRITLKDLINKSKKDVIPAKAGIHKK